jgi:2-dehydro-3-deoxyphosphogluconate aldolase / (4S)-4-hydroxy-2-oxoglutarate aldolase
VAKAAGACAMPGALTPTEIRAALAAGADVVKIFPASSVGGPAHLKALASVFPGVAFCPTGGVDAATAPAYLQAGAAFVGIGGKLVDEARIKAGDKAAIQRAAREALGLMEA